MPPLPQELELTPDLLEYAKAVALTEAQKRCPKYVDFGDVVGEALLHLMSRPPKYDPARGASPKTLIYTIVQRAVLKYVARECKRGKLFRQFEEAADESKPPHGPTEEQMQMHRRLAGKRPTEHEAMQSAVDELLQYVDNEESRTLCRLFIEYNGNRSAVARRLGIHESTVRNRLRMLVPKLQKAGFELPEGMRHDRNRSGKHATRRP